MTALQGTDLRLQWQDLDIVWEPHGWPVTLHWREDKARRLTTCVCLLHAWNWPRNGEWVSSSVVWLYCP